jgi:hypothetical protein
MELIRAVEAAGGHLSLAADGEHVRCRLPVRAEAEL